MPTAAFTTLGCKVNQYETQRILESFEAAGFGIVPFGGPADVYVINSCSVTSVAESKSRYTVRRAARQNPNARIVVTGCAAQMAANRGEVLDGAHVVVPNPQKLDALAHLFRAYPDLERDVRESPLPRNGATPPGRTRATLKVQDGCDVHCSYCSIPFTRPGLTSRPVADILAEVGRLVDHGYLEIVLTGVLIGAYGPATGSGGPDFEELVSHIADHAGEARIRISSIEMRQVTPRLVDLLMANRVVPHLHIPLQSGDSEVLRDMNRPYSQADYLALCRDLRTDLPGLALTTDILVGFPTESPARFLSSVRVCEDVGFLKAHVFPFSSRFGTPADRFGDPVPPEEKRRRSEALAATTAVTADAYRRRFLGRNLRVLVETKKPDGLLHGLTDNYLEVAFPGPASLLRRFAPVRLDELRDGLFLGELAPPGPIGGRTVG
ncbi:MAG: tRNA (N(6)-L-threonylcarbamoyladenosine(37)-C(2))-methylthiotransferase MtaB [Fimbriimonadaceae bacterium]|nr:tRNA (N(6)-L-threonylcarbamoyladenosine(37)-C(2))-methylthiotransferase MtaB [Fimbriimonadaceae bacterium]